jgi:hypothetical protein
MRKTLLAAGVLVGCHAPAKAPPPQRPVGNAVVTSGPVRDDEEAMERWRLLSLTGADWEDKLYAAELDDDTLVAMSKALLRAGGFTCDKIQSYDECGESFSEVQPLEETADFDDPCLRRKLALWSLDQLGQEDAPDILPALDALIAMPEPERELQAAALLMAGDDDRLRLHFMALASRELAEGEVALLKSDGARRHAVTELHLDGALALLKWSEPANRRVMIDALTDLNLSDDTRAQLVADIGQIDDGEIGAALVEIADRGEDCGLAQAAAEALAARGDSSRLPVRPASRDLDAHVRALCMQSFATGEATDRFDAWVGKGNIHTELKQSDWEYDPATSVDDLDDSDGITVEHVDGYLLTVSDLPPDEVDLVELLTYAFEDATCDAKTLTCTMRGGAMTVTFAPSGKSLVIESVTESYEGEEYGGCGC